MSSKFFASIAWISILLGACASPAPTPTTQPVPPIATATSIPPAATPTSQPVPPIATTTSIPPTATPANTATPQPTATASGTPKPTAVTPTETPLPILTPKPAELLIADLHLHPDPSISPTEIKQWMDRNGVHWAGLGAKGGRLLWMGYANALGDRFIAFAGQIELNNLYRQGGLAATEDVNNAVVQDLLQTAEQDLKQSRIKGIGEIFINNLHSSADPALARKGNAAAPSIRALYELVAKYNAFLAFHMEADADSMAQMEQLLASDRSGRILWNHCGFYATADQVRASLGRNPNLFCEVSQRYPPMLGESVARNNPTRKIFDSRGPDANWLKLIEDFPDRFLIGTDAESEMEYDESIKVVRTGLLPYLRPSTAQMVAHENAQYLFGLK